VYYRRHQYYLPWCSQNRHRFDYLGSAATVVLHGDLEPAFQRFFGRTPRPLPPSQDASRGVAARSCFFVKRAVYARANGYAQLALKPVCRKCPWHAVQNSKKWPWCWR
jgi:transcription-repair coupling factor (superfamily II helicase)